MEDLPLQPKYLEKGVALHAAHMCHQLSPKEMEKYWNNDARPIMGQENFMYTYHPEWRTLYCFRANASFLLEIEDWSQCIFTIYQVLIQNDKLFKVFKPEKTNAYSGHHKGWLIHFIRWNPSANLILVILQTHENVKLGKTIITCSINNSYRQFSGAFENTNLVMRVGCR